MLVSYFTVLNSATSWHIHFELEATAKEGARIRDCTFTCRHRERVTLVANDDQIRERVELEGVVKRPVDGTRVKGEGTEVSLGEDCLCKMCRKVG